MNIVVLIKQVPEIELVKVDKAANKVVLPSGPGIVNPFDEYAVEETFGRAPANNIHRQLSCFFCDEQEHCISNGVPIPYELNILRVQNYIPGGIFPPGVFPKAGFA